MTIRKTGIMKEQVLIVDDEQDVAELLRYNLEKANYAPIVAYNGEEAINAVQCHDPQAVLLDVMMPELNGWEVCRILRQSSKGRSLPIIMLTALSDEESRVKGLSLGADDYLAKPFSLRELLLKLRKSIDERRAMNLLRTREQEQETSLRYLVHEMKNSLTVIGGFTALAIKADEGGGRLRTVNAAARHAENLLEDISLLSRLEKGGTLPLEALDLAAEARDAVEFVRDTANKKSVELAVMKNAPVLVRADRTAIRQVLVNLLSNAVKYSRDRGRVWIYFDEREDRIEMTIRDEGPGIKHDELPRIFDKFYRAGGSERIKGAGLGLYIVKLLSAAMDGTVTAASDPGSGSSFTVSLLKQDEARPLPASSAAARQNNNKEIACAP
jgi:signal transduction histidine kinase